MNNYDNENHNDGVENDGDKDANSDEH